MQPAESVAIAIPNECYRGTCAEIEAATMASTLGDGLVSQ